MQIFETKKEIITIIKESRTCFNKIKQRLQTQPLMIFFFISKSAVLKKKIKIRSVSKEDTNQFFFMKNSDMHLMKI